MLLPTVQPPGDGLGGEQGTGAAQRAAGVRRDSAVARELLAQGGFLGPKYNPFNAGEANVPKYCVRDLDLPMGVDWARMEGRYSLLSSGRFEDREVGHHRYVRIDRFVLQDRASS